MLPIGILRSQMREFDHLNNPEKVKAVLATVHEPVSRQLAFELASVQFPKLNKGDRQGVEVVFTETVVSLSDPKGRQKFWYPMDRREAVLTEIDVDQRSVESHIADVLISYLPAMGLGKGLGNS